MTFMYGRTRGTDQWANGAWNRLTQVNNGQGGTVNVSTIRLKSRSPVAVDATPGVYDMYNYRRVTTKAVSDGRGHTYTWSYAYTNPRMNSGGKVKSGDAKGIDDEPNSAVLYYNANRGTNPPNPTQYQDWLAHRKHAEFRGHASVTETAPDGGTTVTAFYQGYVDTCAQTKTGAALDSESMTDITLTSPYLQTLWPGHRECDV